MRKKSDEKRQYIIDTAYQLFRASGFEKTSMAEISAKVGGSKATLYNYYSSKEELFVDCMLDLAEHYLEDIFSSMHDPKMDLQTALHGFGEKALRLICSPEMLDARRLMFAEAERSGIGKMFYEKISSWQEEITGFLARSMDDGKLRQCTPLLASLQFRALLEAEVFEPCILSVRELPLNEETIKNAVDHAVDTFLRAYAPTDISSGGCLPLQ